MSVWLEPEPSAWTLDVDDALAEDVGYGDITGSALPPELLVRWHIEAQGEGVVCGVGILDGTRPGPTVPTLSSALS